MQTGFPSSLACRLEPNFSATGSREKDEEGGLQGSGLSMLLAASRPEPGPAGSTPPHTHSRLTLVLRQHTTFTAGKSLAHLTQIPQAVEQALAFPYLPGCRLAYNRTEQCPRLWDKAHLACEASGPGKPGLKFVLLCNHSGGLSQFRLASVSLLVQWAGKGSQHRTSGQPLGVWGQGPSVYSQLGPASP